MKSSSLLFLFVVMAVATSCSSVKKEKTPKNSPSHLREWVFEGYRHVSLDSAEMPLEFSSPVKHRSLLIFGLQKRGVIAVTRSGRMKWELPVEGGADGSPATWKKNVFIGGNDGFLYSLDAGSGEVEWKQNLKGCVWSKPVVSAGRIFANSANNVLYALDASTGKWLWHYKRNVTSFSSIKGNSTPLVDDQKIYAGFTDGFLVALEMNTGNVIWEKKIHKGAKFEDVDAEPVLVGDNLIVPSFDGGLYSLRKKDGAINWRYDAGGARGVVVKDGRIYLASSDTHFYCLDAATSKLIWKYPLRYNGIPTKPVIMKDNVVFGSSESFVYMLNRNTGELVKRISIGSGTGFYANPLVSGNRLYMLSNYGNLYNFKFKR